MRHRMLSVNTGLGDPSSCLLSNIWSNNKKANEVIKSMFDDALELKPLKEYGGFDFNIQLANNRISIDFGYEPAYQYEELLIYHIDNSKSNCNMKQGKARGVYGSDIEIFKEVKYDNLDEEFKELIDKWYDKILESLM